MTLLYLMRHGETELNTKGVYYGWTDCGLSEKGVKQAQKVALMLKDIKFDTVISSPLKRAKDTAAIVSKFPPEEIVLDGRLKELNFGSWEGRHYQSIQEWDRENWDLWVNNWKEAAPPGGRSYGYVPKGRRKCQRNIGKILRTNLVGSNPSGMFAHDHVHFIESGL